MTIVEFLHPLKRRPIRDICLAALYFAHRYNQKDALTVEEVRSLLRRGRIPRATKINLADTLARSAPFVDPIGKKENKFIWALTATGQDHIRSLLGLPSPDVEIEHDVFSLECLVKSLKDKDVRNYILEGIKCLSVGALRASVVFLWSGAVRRIQEEVFKYGASAVTSAIQKFDPKAKLVKRRDDLIYTKELTLLLVSQELGIFDKNERGILEEALNLRNKCGHPGKYKPGPKKVSSFIEDIIGIVFS
ncbi:MAG: hypothetical protein IBV53_00100 [Candidatus Atribacteria bacterium]